MPKIRPDSVAESRPHPVILFDGLCSFCDGTVSFIVRRDPRAHFRFAPLQSEVGQRLLRAHRLPTDDWDTLVLIDGANAYRHSDALLRVARELRGPWRGLVVLHSIPRRLRDWLYGRFVSNRYRWFGRKQV